jgi:phospholipid/cholesterol/gamma-HCH transport system ATP-binding protein
MGLFERHRPPGHSNAPPRPPGTPIVRCVDISVSFGALRVFEHLSLDVNDGEILTIVGGSGCGKSVLLKLVLGLVQWQKGAVLVDGEDITGYGEDAMQPVRRKVGMLFQNGALFDSLTVRENIAYPLRERGVDDEDKISQRTVEVLEMVGLPGIETKMPAELSGGMRKRVALARAIAEAPKVLMYDEPTTGLDPINVRRISELIVDINQRLRVTSICVTHDLASAYMISDRMAMIAERKVIAAGTPDQLRGNPDPAVQQFLTAMDPNPTRAA